MSEIVKAAGDRPVERTSRCSVTNKDSSWRVHEFEVRSGGGEELCRCSALRMAGSLLLWVGSSGTAQLGEAALGVPAPGAVRAALATPLLGADGGADGAEGAATALARRLAAALSQPVYVFCGAIFDRFTAPLVERGLIAEIRSWGTL